MFSVKHFLTLLLIIVVTTIGLTAACGEECCGNGGNGDSYGNIYSQEGLVNADILDAF